MSELLGRLLVADRVAATEYMMAEMQRQYTEDLLTKWREMITQYYTIGYDNTGGVMDKTTRELQELELQGSLPDGYIIDEEFKIRDKVLGEDF